MVEAQDHAVLNKKVSVESRAESIELLLKRLEKQGGVRFAYSSKSINVKKVMSVKVTGVTLLEVLREVFPDSSVRFKVVGSQVAIFREKVASHVPDIEKKLFQNVRGEVRDLETNQPLIGVNIVLVGSDPLLGASTDRYGQFKIPDVPLGRATFRVSYLGYKPHMVANIAVNSGKELILNVMLEESSQSLEQVLVRADFDKSKPLNEMSVVSAKSFSVEETSLYAGSFNDPARMASSYAGVTSGQDDSENQIIIRGNSPRGLLWRVEGVEIPNPNHFADDGSSSGAISILNSNMLANSDFLTGAFSAEYGNAFSGVFDIKLRNGNNEKREYAVKAGLLGLDASAEGPIQRKNGKNIPNASYLVSYRYSTVSILNSIGLDYDDSFEDPAFQDIAFKLHVPTNGLGVFSLWGLGGLSKAVDTETVNIGNRSFDIKDEDEYNVGIVGLSHDYNLSKNAYLETKISYSVSEYGFYLENNTDQNIFVEDDEQYRNDALRISSSYHKKFNARHSLKTGVIYSRLLYDLESRGKLGSEFLVYQADERGSTDMWQGFVSHKLDFTDNLAITAGIHYIRLNLGGQQNLEPRFGMNWSFADNQALSFGVGWHSRREATSLYFTKLSYPDSTIHQPNTKLDFAKARHFVLGYDRKFGKDFHLKLEAYYQNLYDIPIAPSPNAAFSAINQENAYIRTPLISEGKGENYGVELTFEKFLSQGYYFLLNGSLYRSLYFVNGETFNTQYNGNYNAGLVAGKEFRLNGENKVLIVGVEGVFTGGKRIFPVDVAASESAGTTVYDTSSPYGRQLPDYNRIDFQIALKTHKKKSTHELKLDVQNLTSRQNIFYEEYSFDQQKVAPLGYLGQIIPVLSYKVIF